MLNTMADDEDKDNKTEDPTEQRLRKLREDGQVPTSKEVNNMFAMLGCVALAGGAAPWAFSHILEFCAAAIANAGVTDLSDGGAVTAAVAQLGMTMMIALLPLLGILLVLGYAGSFLQNGLVLSTKPISPDLSKISILAGFGRIFSWKSVMELLKSIVKLGVVGGAMIAVVWQRRDDLVAIMDGDATNLLHLLQLLMLNVLGAALAVMIVLAIADVLFQRFQFLAEHRMSRQDLKDEMRDSEGDPHVKQRQRQIRNERARKRMMANVPKSDVIITNPTHYAVALRYKPDEGDAAPIVLAKGVDAVALRIREVANEHNIPLYEDPPLARQLWRDVEIDEVIPITLYEVVAKVMALVSKLKKTA